MGQQAGHLPAKAPRVAGVVAPEQAGAPAAFAAFDGGQVTSNRGATGAPSRFLSTSSAVVVPADRRTPRDRGVVMDLKREGPTLPAARLAYSRLLCMIG